MSKTNIIASSLRENKKLIIIFSVALFLMELEIFAVAAIKSGHKSRLHIVDTNNNVIYETDGSSLSEFNKYHFEQTFGPIEQYKVKLSTRNVEFPFRAWFAAAVGIPVGIVLLLAFIVKAYTSLFYGEENRDMESEMSEVRCETRFEKIISTISRFNIFTIGFLLFLAVFSYWVVPNFIAYAGRVGAETFSRYKWVFLSAVILISGIVVWSIYLRYLLARKVIESRAEIEKCRLELEYNQKAGSLLRLAHDKNKTGNDCQVELESPKIIDAKN